MTFTEKRLLYLQGAVAPHFFMSKLPSLIAALFLLARPLLGVALPLLAEELLGTLPRRYTAAISNTRGSPFRKSPRASP